MSEAADRDYMLGTDDRELARLGLQHRVWRPAVLDCWRRAGIAAGWRVLDVGAGPGFAALDLAEVVGPGGEVVAVERSERFVRAGEAAAIARGLRHVRFHHLDLMSDPLPGGPFDAAWCRWVAAFVSSPQALVERLAAVVRPGGVAVFHEYADYASWRLAPRRAGLEEFVRRVMANWREAGGEPDVALNLPGLLADAGFAVRHAAPLVSCVRPRDDAWRWPAGFVDVHLDRMLALGRVDAAWVGSVREELRAAEGDPATLMITPLVLEIVADRHA
jgi:SAM-dependent methyltransferase